MDCREQKEALVRDILAMQTDGSLTRGELERLSVSELVILLSEVIDKLDPFPWD